MKRDSRHINDSWSSRIYDYLFGTMPNRDRSTLEREEQIDMFLSDALTGLEGLSEDEYLSDLKDMHGRLNVHTGNRGVNKWIVVAATLLFIVGMVFLLYLLIPQDSDKLAQNKVVPVSKVEKVNDNKKETRKPVVAEREIVLRKSVRAKVEPVRQEGIDNGNDAKSVKDPVMFNIVDDDVELDEELEVSESESSEEVVRKKAMPKVVTHAGNYELDRVGAEAASPSPVKIEDRKAEPEMGMKKYKETIKSQIKKLRFGKRIKVTVRLTVSAKGNIAKVEILKTSDRSFNSEIERIFKEGPGWQPAYRNGIVIEESVKINLTIKKGKRPLSSLQT